MKFLRWNRFHIDNLMLAWGKLDLHTKFLSSDKLYHFKKPLLIKSNRNGVELLYHCLISLIQSFQTSSVYHIVKCSHENGIMNYVPSYVKMVRYYLNSPNVIIPLRCVSYESQKHFCEFVKNYKALKMNNYSEPLEMLLYTIFVHEHYFSTCKCVWCITDVCQIRLTNRNNQQNTFTSQLS